VVKKKLLRFSENLTFPNMFQPQYVELKGGYHLRGKWKTDFFNNDHPITLELGCGKGEYTTGLAERYPEKNHIGIDIKGARMWKGCKYSNDRQLTNVAFIRTRINLIGFLFAPQEISEIWLTFPDPQPQLSREKKRLTSPDFLMRYKNILHPEHRIHLKTDDTGLFEYTLSVIETHGHDLLYMTKDVYDSDAPWEVKNITTFYEAMFLEEGKNINYLNFRLKQD